MQRGPIRLYVRGLTLNGEIFDFALNLQTDHEWASAAFERSAAATGRSNGALQAVHARNAGEALRPSPPALPCNVHVTGVLRPCKRICYNPPV
jgi:hypothetical protein